MASDEKSVMWFITRWYVLLILLIMLLVGGATVVSSVFNLAWLPWQMKMQTAITRNSNGYITAQIGQLREWRTDYEAASPEQKMAIRRQMQGIADQIPDNVPTDIAAFLGRN